MRTTPEAAIWIAWAVWVVSWFLAAAWSRKTVKRAGRAAEQLHLWLTAAGFVLIAWSRAGASAPSVMGRILGRFGYQPAQLWITPAPAGWALFALAVSGFLFCWWARLHLGRLWSGTVTRKDGHHVVDTGPYALVRHPIYTGLILAAFATALDQGASTSLAGAVLMTLGLWIKARLEERFLRAELGPEAYGGYAARTPMLIPHPVFGRSSSRAL